MSFLQKSKLKKIAVLSSAFLATGSIWMVSTLSVSAAANQLYLTPASNSVQKGNSFSVSLRVNPGTAIDTVTASISYDASKLTLQGIDCSGSPLTAFPSCPSSGNPVSITSYIPGGSVSSDSFVAKLTFSAVAGSGSSSLGLSGDTAYGGNSLGATSTGSAVTFTSPATPPPSCPSGQTGTPPNCVTPPAGTGSGGTSGGSSGGSTKPTAGSSSTPSSGTSTTPTTTTPTTPAVANGTAMVSTKKTTFTAVTVTVTSKDPTQVYMRYGTDKNSLTQQTAISDSATTHTITTDPKLIPGQTYYYVIVSITQAGAITQTEVDSFATTGLTVRIGLFDKNTKPLAGKQVTLHSTPVTGKADDRGFVNFSNVTPGIHQVMYVDGKKTYTQQITVDNNVTTVNGEQVAPVQTISVVYDLTASRSILVGARYVIIALLLIVVVAAVMFGRRKVHATNMGPPVSLEPVVVGGRRAAQPPVQTIGGPIPAPKAIETSQRLEVIPTPQTPLPGSTVTPVSSERKLF